MTIECFGLPGTGKTTMARELSDLLGISIVRPDTFSERLLLNQRFLLIYPGTFFWLFFLVIHGGVSIKTRYEKFQNAFLGRNAAVLAARALPIGIVVEGQLQNLFSFFERPLAREEMHRVISRFIAPSLLLYFRDRKSVV